VRLRILQQPTAIERKNPTYLLSDQFVITVKKPGGK
jgi:hypothetical protein